jgi:Trp operon repressor
MVQMSKRLLSVRIQREMMKLIFAVLGAQTSVAQFDQLLQGIFSPVEQEMIAKRIAIFLLLMKNLEWPQIQTTLKVSPATISKCKMILVHNTTLQDSLRPIITRQIISLFIEEIINELKGPGTFISNWNRAWKKRQEIEQK